MMTHPEFGAHESTLASARTLVGRGWTVFPADHPDAGLRCTGMAARCREGRCTAATDTTQRGKHPGIARWSSVNAPADDAQLRLIVQRELAFPIAKELVGFGVVRLRAERPHIEVGPAIAVGVSPHRAVPRDARHVRKQSGRLAYVREYEQRLRFLRGKRRGGTLSENERQHQDENARHIHSPVHGAGDSRWSITSVATRPSESWRR